VIRKADSHKQVECTSTAQHSSGHIPIYFIEIGGTLGVDA